MSYSLFLGLCLLLVSACTPQNSPRSTPRQQQQIYNPAFSPTWRLIHRGDSSRLYLSVPAQSYRLQYRCLDRYPGGQVLLNKQTWMTHEQSGQLLVETLNVPRSSYVLEVNVETADRQLWREIIPVNKEVHSAQTIYAAKGGADKPLMRNYLRVGEEVEFYYSDPSREELYLRYYAESRPIAHAPFVEKSEERPLPKQHERILTVKTGQPVKLETEGLYFIQTDTNTQRGTFLMGVDVDFPRMSRVTDLIEASRYISRNEEFERMRQASSPKVALDEFWQARHRDPNTAKRTLQLYYHRAQEANTWFTVHREGWKTDRGMVYMIFGSPRQRSKFEDREVWFYQLRPDNQYTEFVFMRRGELYVLDRHPRFRSFWNEEVQRWRQARPR